MVNGLGLGEGISPGSLWSAKPAACAELQTTALSLGGEGCPLGGISGQLFCLRWPEQHHLSVLSQESHKWTHLVQPGKGYSWGLLGSHGVPWLLFHFDVCVINVFWVLREVKWEGKEEEREVRGVPAWEHSSDKCSECQSQLKVYFRRHQEWNLLCWYCAVLICPVPPRRTVNVNDPPASL